MNTPKNATQNTAQNGARQPVSRGVGRSGHGNVGALRPGQSAANFGATMKRTVAYLRPELGAIIGALVLSAVSVALNVSGPKLLGAATDEVFNGFVGHMLAKIPGHPSKDAAVAMLEKGGQEQFAKMLSGMDVTPGQGINWENLGFYVLAALGVYAGAALAMFVAGMLMRNVVQNTGYRMRREVNEKIDRLPLSYLDKQARGDVLSRVTNDVDNLTQTLNTTLTQLFTSVLSVLGILGMMFWISWKLALAALVIMPLGALGGKILISRSQPHFVTQWSATGEVTATVEEAFTGAEVLQLYGLQDRFTDRFNEHNERLREASFKSQFISMLMQPMMSLVSNLSYVLVAVLGGVMVANGNLTLGGVQAFIQYSRQFTQPLGQIMQALNMLQSAMASAERVFELLEAEEMSPEPPANPAWPAQVRGDLDLHDVVFAYQEGRPVITGLDLKVKAGQTVAIVGPTGAGKTTLVNLLMHFYDLQSGQIRIDGVDVNTVPRRDLRSQFGMVLQDTWLFKGTIRENLALGCPGASDEQIQAAARATGAHHLIATLPQGYDTQLEENGQGLSAGEKQLLTIARAFLSDPAILILDEATSAVDTRTEMLIGQGLSRLRRGRTGFIIAHRLSTIRDADLILVLENGNVVESGTHEQLIESRGAYWRLYQAQFMGAPSRPD